MRMFIDYEDNCTTAQKVGKRIESYIKNTPNMTQTKFAKDIAKSSDRTVRKYITGETKMDIEMFKGIANRMGVSYSYLLGDTPFLDQRGNIIYALKELGFSISYNPKDENQLCVNHMDMELLTDINSLTDTIKEILLFKMYTLSKDIKKNEK